MDKNSDVFDWEDLKPEDQERVNEIIEELHKMFNRYVKRDDECQDDSTSTE